MKTIFSKVKLKGRQILLLSILILFAAIAEMMLPSLLAQMINSGVTDNSQNMILVLAVIMAGVTALAGVVNFLSVKIASRISTDFSANLREQVFEKVQSFSAAELDHFGTASLVTRSTSDITNVQNFLTMLLRIGILAPMMAIAGLVFSAATGGKVSSVLSVAIPVLLIGCGIIILFASRYSIKLRQKLDRINQLFLESLEGVRVIRAFNKQKTESYRFGEANKDYAATAMLSGRITSLLLPVINVIFGVTTAAVLGLGAHYVETGAMEVGSLVANSQYISMVLMSAMMLALVIMMFPTAYACSKRIGEVLETETSIKDGSFSMKDRPLRSTVEFRHVTFAYPGAEEPILKDISFEAHPGEITAIIGGTGRGKSSILKLIPRLYDPLFGEVLIDGVNVKEYAVDELRSLIGYVPQKNVLFSGDIASNLNFGKNHGTEQEWMTAAKIACAEEFILKKENGYHEAIAQGGTNLSGGQRQRMAIARAVMKEPEIYVFDDSFSALDMKTDQVLRKNLKAAMGNATVIMVAQRVSTILDADRILVVDDGMIVGQGTHRELLNTCPLYREIAEVQLGKEAVSYEKAYI
ncbi:ABC transporter ATP-binding protein [Coprococcus sp. AF21-14LB]|uniref:ABC transporter ATP-binding protein n=1 Tax=Coprococcus sp. AF21-14LB TaxID=2292231 RepID=UPI000E541798|nr:ABC transporter ATP-binding protein [Coprococcus sp. AF21-14LB]RGS75917.1 ABC transporter ATP-binding protein [Coprococcus sp. AF21-14LB]